jgi:hypothetical protein
MKPAFFIFNRSDLGRPGYLLSSCDLGMTWEFMARNKFFPHPLRSHGETALTIMAIN